MVLWIWLLALVILLPSLLARLRSRQAERRRTKAVSQAQSAMDVILARHGYPFRVYGLGTPDTNPRSLFVCVNTSLDKERDQLRGDRALLEELRQALRRAGYPARSVPLVTFSFESQETVDRDFGGNWYYAKK